MPATQTHSLPAVVRRQRCLSGLVAIALSLCSGLVAPLGAQSTSALDYVDHISLDFAHDTVLNTNIALYYHDANGDLQPPPSYGTYSSNGSALFYLFSTKEIRFFSYTGAGAVPFNGGASDWIYVSIFPSDISLTNGSEVSYTPIEAAIRTQPIVMTGSRNALYSYNITTGFRQNITTLSTDPSGDPYTAGNALLTTGYYSSLVIAGDGGIYSMDRRNAVPGLLTPLIPAAAPGANTGDGQLANPSAMNVGPDGLLYVLDYGNHRIQKFDLLTGEFRGLFALPEGITVFSTSLAISLEGHIYLGDGLGGGSVLNLDGELLGTFHPPEADPSWVDGGLIPDNFGNISAGAGSFLQYDGLGNIFTYVEGQGIYMYRDPSFVAVPEPSSWALLVLGLVPLQFRFRSRSKS